MKNVSKCAKFLRKDWIPRINGINQTDRHTFSQTYNKKNIKKKWLKATGQKEHLKNSWTYPLTNTEKQTHSHTLRYRPTHKHWQPDPLTNTEKQTPHKHWQTDPLTYTDKQIPHIHWQTNPLTNKLAKQTRTWIHTFKLWFRIVWPNYFPTLEMKNRISNVENISREVDF